MCLCKCVWKALLKNLFCTIFFVLQVLSQFSQNRWGDNSQLMSFDDLFDTEFIDQEEDEEGIIELHDYRKVYKIKIIT